MTVTIGYWAIPVLLTLITWGLAILWPMEPSRGDYDFGPAVSGLFRFVGGIIGTLVYWLVYFICLAIFRH
jgi:hypothetical protein